MLPQANKMTLKSLYADLPKIPNFFVKKNTQIHSSSIQLNQTKASDKSRISQLFPHCK